MRKFNVTGFAHQRIYFLLRIPHHFVVSKFDCQVVGNIEAAGQIIKYHRGNTGNEKKVISLRPILKYLTTPISMFTS